MTIRGYCPSALKPMQTGDGLLVRLKPEGNLLSARQCKALGRLAKTIGNGILDVTRRANLQIRGVQPADYDALISELRNLDLVDVSAEAEARRNIILSPFAGTVGNRLNNQLASTLSASTLTLPGKFGFAIDTGEQPVLQNESADIRIERDTDKGLLVRADGIQLGIAVTEQNAVTTAIALAEWFVAVSNVKAASVKRMAALIADGELPDGSLQGQYKPATSRCPPLPGERIDAGLFVAAEFGQISADTLISIAPFAPLMLTPWRILLLTNPDAGMQHSDKHNWQSVIEQIDDLIIECNDPRLHVLACVGAPACDSALQPTRPLARELADAMAAKLNTSNTLHVSGCQKGCASRDVANLTLVGARDGFDAITNGNTFAPPSYRALPANVSAILSRLPETVNFQAASVGVEKVDLKVDQAVCNQPKSQDAKD